MADSMVRVRVLVRIARQSSAPYAVAKRAAMSRPPGVSGASMRPQNRSWRLNSVSPCRNR